MLRGGARDGGTHQEHDVGEDGVSAPLGALSQPDVPGAIAERRAIRSHQRRRDRSVNGRHELRWSVPAVTTRVAHLRHQLGVFAATAGVAVRTVAGLALSEAITHAYHGVTLRPSTRARRRLGQRRRDRCGRPRRWSSTATPAESGLRGDGDGLYRRVPKLQSMLPPGVWDRNAGWAVLLAALRRWRRCIATPRSCIRRLSVPASHSPRCRKPACECARFVPVSRSCLW